MAANARRKLPTDYSSLKMPAETQNYVPKLQAVKNIIARPADFGLTLPPLRNHPYFLAVPIDRDMDVAVAARLAGMPLAEFQTLNPQMNKPVILAAGTPQVMNSVATPDRLGSVATPALSSASRSRSRLRRPRLREIVPDGGLHDRLERLFIELLVLRDIDRPRLAQELRVEELLRVRKA